MRPPVTKKSILSSLRDTRPESRKVVERAWDFAERAHRGQTRLSGAPYFEDHTTTVAYYLADAGMDAPTVAAGLLHDTLEDTETTPEEIKKEFGEEILFLVEGVTKLGKIKYRGLERHVESLRHLLIATASDIRVIIIKLYDRLHNMETNRFHPTDRQVRKAKETMEVYVPIAERLGMNTIKTALEDLSFQTLNPKEYEKTFSLLEKKRKEMYSRLEEDIKDIKKHLGQSGVQFRTEYRFKSVYSLYRKLIKKEGEIERVYDIVALRIVTKTVDDCYKSLGAIHSFWRPIPGRVKDYIACPKPNGYQSLHTTTITRRGITIEIQLRTELMHSEAQFGVASHFNYKSGTRKSISTDWMFSFLPALLKKTTRTIEPPRWLSELNALQKDHPDYETLNEILHQDFFAERMFVFTPKGDVIDIPRDATPVDFAYAIHSEIGDHMSGAKVNGKLVSLDTPLKNGDIVDIITKKNITVSARWIAIAKTANAKSHIKSALKKIKEGT